MEKDLICYECILCSQFYYTDDNPLDKSLPICYECRSKLREVWEDIETISPESLGSLE